MSRINIAPRRLCQLFILAVINYFVCDPSLAFNLPDTGQTKCYQAVSPYAEIPCAGTGQDGEYNINPLSYTDNGDGTVVDNNTGLVWQKEDDGWMYNWYEASGTPDPSYNPFDVNVCGSLSLSGKSDWRLPSKQELLSLVDYAIPSPGSSVRPVFTNTSGDYYWSSTTSASDQDNAWNVHFADGSIDAIVKGVIMYVRCVRGGQSSGPQLLDNGNGTVTDSRTGLVWQQSEPDAGTWGEALAYCRDLSLGDRSDWRLPNIKELASLTSNTSWDPAIDTTKFPGARVFNCWSSTTNIGNTFQQKSAWFVYTGNGSAFSIDKSYGLDFRCVRGGQSGTIGNLGSLVFSVIPSPQTVGGSFTVTVMAKDGFGETLAGLNGTVSLHGNLGLVSPDELRLVNGVGTANVTIDGPGSNVVIAAAGFGMSGASNPFTVTGGSATPGYLSGIVRNSLGETLTGAVVYLDDDPSTPSSLSTQTSHGFYSFGDLACGVYTLWAVNASVRGLIETNRLSVKIPCGGSPVTQDLRIDFCSAEGRTPILLVPGIMGSSTGDGGFYPSLPKEGLRWDSREWQNSNSYGLHDPWDKVGWKELVRKLQSLGYELGCTLFPVPYDWRRSIDDVAAHDLKDAIDKAKNSSGKSRVNIIAHSMGGLVTRSYIRNFSGTDIDKVAMVGTPNHGAVAPYYLYEGGDPVLADLASADGLIDRVLNMYTKTMNATYQTMKGEPLYDQKCLESSTGCTVPYLDTAHPRKNPVDIKEFIRRDVPSVGQLLATFNFLTEGDYKTFGKEINSWLNDLNDSFNFKGVSAKVFAGTGQETLATIKVNKNSTNVYEHGAPEGDPVRRTLGDGTVLQVSTVTSGAGIDASRSGKHSGLVSAYMCDSPDGDAGYLNFITGNLYLHPGCRTAYQADLNPDYAGAGGVGTLSIRVQGRVSPYLTSPSGEKSGINPTTHYAEYGIPRSSVVAGMDSGSITVESAADGTYRLELGGERLEDYIVTFTYFDGSRTFQKEYWGFNNGGRTVAFVLHATDEAPLKIDVAPTQPQELLAEPIVSADLTTRLLWSAHPDPEVAGYRIYGRRLDEPKFTLVGESAGTSFDTNDPWAADETVPTRVYAVSAVTSGGSESFFSQFAENDDQDHDGLPDSFEAGIGSDPSLADSDDDGMDDLAEFKNGSDPLDPLSPPRAMPDDISTLDDEPVMIDVLANDACAAGKTLEVSAVVQQPVHGTATISDAGILYTPRLNFAGEDQFTYRPSDGVVSGNVATVTVTVQRNPAALVLLPPEEWQQGSRQTIRWHGMVDTGRVSIQLLKGGKLKATISAGVANNGSFAWTVPSTLPVGSDYQIKVSWLGNPALINTMSQPFTIAAPVLTVGQPDGSAAVERGTLLPIRWGGPQGGSVKLLLLQGTVLKATVAAGTPNDGAFDWVVPTTLALAGDYQVKLIWLANPAVTGASNVLSVVATSGQLQVTQPDGVAAIQQGAVQRIQWDGIPRTGKVKILLYQGAVVKATISAAAANSGSFDWNVPPTLAAGAYAVRVTWLSDGSFSGESAGFSVASPQLTVSQPDGDEAQRGSWRLIQWTGPTGGSVKIQLYQGTTLKTTIAASTPNDGMFGWVVPITFAIGDYQAQVTWLPNPAVKGTSTTFSVVTTTGAHDVYQPDGTGAVRQGEVRQIRWDGIPMTGKALISLHQGKALKATIAAAAPNEGTLAWKVPASLPVGRYTVRVTWLADAAFTGESAAFDVVSPALNVWSPAGADVQRGSLQTIRWDGPEGGSVKILLYQRATLKATIAASTPNDGSFDWVVPTTLAIGGEYRARVIWLSNPAVAGQSNAFSVIATSGTLAVTKPYGTAVVEQGSRQPILWEGIPGTGNVKILLYQGATLKATIAPSTPNDGSFDWTVPGKLVPGTYSIRLAWLSDGAFAAQSEVFTVVAPTMSVSQPAGGGSWDQGTTQGIAWSCGGGFGRVKIDLYKGATLYRTLAASTPNDSGEPVAVPAVLAPASDYRVKVTWLDNPQIAAWSAGVMTLR